MDRRLGIRYQKLVKAHMHTVPRTAAGPSCGCGEAGAFAATQAAWRFLNNDRVLLSALVAPLRDVGRQAVGQSRADFVLLSNVAAGTANGSDLALWYYWRWRIESFFKLLKSSGQELEHWRQETGLAIGRRLLVAAMAWELQRQETPEAEEIKRILVPLSGRQMKRTRPWTTPALLAGLFVLLPMLDLLGHYHGDLSQLRHLALTTIPFLDSG